MSVSATCPVCWQVYQSQAELDKHRLARQRCAAVDAPSERVNRANKRTLQADSDSAAVEDDEGSEFAAAPKRKSKETSARKSAVPSADAENAAALPENEGDDDPLVAVTFLVLDADDYRFPVEEYLEKLKYAVFQVFVRSLRPFECSLGRFESRTTHRCSLRWTCLERCFVACSRRVVMSCCTSMRLCWRFQQVVLKSSLQSPRWIRFLAPVGERLNARSTRILLLR